MATDLAASAVFAINCESRIADRLQSKPARKERETERERNVEKKLYIIIKANGAQTCPSNDDDAAVSVPVDAVDDDDEP